MIKTKKNGSLGRKTLLGSPYSFKENFGWFKRYICGPTTTNYGNVDYISKSVILNKISPRYTISFIGDIMDMNLRDLIIGQSVKRFIEGSDFLIGNFEATLITDKKVINGKRHKPQIMDALESVFAPNKTYLSTANNHSGDFGKKSFLFSVNRLRSKGFNIFGDKNTPYLDLASDLRVVGATQWSNRPCDYLTRLQQSSQYLKENSFNLLFPHWGYEMELYPRIEIIKKGKDLLSKFDALVGHHSHCPQPVSFFPFCNDNKLIAYSLGNFCDGKKLEMQNYGILIKIVIGIDANDKWQVGKCDWSFLKTHSLSKTEFLVDTVDNFSDFLFEYKSVNEEYMIDEVFNDNWCEMEQVVVCV